MIESFIEDINREIAKENLEEISTLKRLKLHKEEDLRCLKELIVHYIREYIYPASHLLALQSFTQAKHYDLKAFLEPVPSGLTLTLLKQSGIALDYVSKDFEGRIALHELEYKKEKKRANFFLVLRAEAISNVVSEMVHYHRDYKEVLELLDFTEDIKENCLPSWLFKELTLDIV